MMAMPTKSTVAAAVWPEGKLEVAGVELSRITSGRGRGTTNVTDKHAVVSMSNARVRNAASRKCLRSERKPPTMTGGPTTGSVLNDAVATCVMSFHVGVRFRAKY